MKTSKLVVMSVLLSTSFGWAAQVVQKDLGTFGSWKAAQIKGHDLWGKDACIGYTKARETSSTLEIYAEKVAGAQTTYVEPTVQIVARGEPQFVRGILTDDQKSAQFQLTLESNTANPAAFGLLSRVGDRAALIAMIKKANVLTVNLVSASNKIVRTLTFSLSGSSKASDAVFNGCALSVTDDQQQ